MMTALLTALGVPMILAGDEIGHTQRGNNNAYSQDNDLTWLDWENADWAFRDFVRDMIAWRKATPAVRRTAFFSGAVDPDTGERDVTWLDGVGAPRVNSDDWTRDREALGVLWGEADTPGPLMFLAPRR
jgi:glycogen operon protein